LKRFYIGIDVSKSSLDVYVLGATAKSAAFQVQNTPGGFALLVEKVLQLAGEAAELVFCMESTGGYEFDAACYLAEREHFVSIVNPARVKYYAASRGWQNKTDKADARTIAEYASKNELRRWHLCDPLRRELCQLNRHRIRLQREQNRFQNWLEHSSHRPELEVKQNRAMVMAIEEQLRTTESTIQEKLPQDPKLLLQVQELMRVNGAGAVLAITLVCEAPDAAEFQSAQQYAAFAGLNPRKEQSGSTLNRGRVSKAGNKWIRWATHMPAQRASHCHPDVKALCQRLEAKHRKPKQIRTAAARKLLMICFGVLKALADGKPRFYAGKDQPQDLAKERKIAFKFRRSSRRPRLEGDRTRAKPKEPRQRTVSPSKKPPSATTPAPPQEKRGQRATDP
jgi:transposase